jgi:hypothetical protein
MTQFAVSIVTPDTTVDIEKNCECGLDALDMIMGAVGDALSAAGFDDDHRLHQMRDYWAEINASPSAYDEWLVNDVVEACDPHVAPLNEKPWGPDVVTASDFQIGDIVKVFQSTVSDDWQVLGDVGRIVSIMDSSWPHPQTILVSFKFGKMSQWYVAPVDLELILRP